jgi:MFS family permease
LALGVVVPLSNWLGDRIGATLARRLSMIGFALASALCGLAWNLDSMIVFRVKQAADLLHQRVDRHAGHGRGLVHPAEGSWLRKRSPHHVERQCSPVYPSKIKPDCVATRRAAPPGAAGAYLRRRPRPS